MDSEKETVKIELSPVDKQVWDAIDQLQAAVEAIEHEEDIDEDDWHPRVYTVAMLMSTLGLDVDALGYLAKCLLDIEKITEEEPSETKSLETVRQELKSLPPKMQKLRFKKIQV